MRDERGFEIMAELPGASRVVETQTGHTEFEYPENFNQMPLMDKLAFLDKWLTDSRRDGLAGRAVSGALRQLGSEIDAYVPKNKDEESFLMWAKEQKNRE